jgi:hypothetical protein
MSVLNYGRRLRMAGNKELLDELMALTIEELLTVIKSGEANPAILNVARQLLKDNQVTASVKEDNAMQNLVEVLPFREDDEPIAATNT